MDFIQVHGKREKIRKNPGLPLGRVFIIQLCLVYSVLIFDSLVDSVVVRIACLFNH